LTVHCDNLAEGRKTGTDTEEAKEKYRKEGMTKV
jgi:hypothetical protein